MNDKKLSIEEFKDNNPVKEKERFLVISNLVRFASVDVWAGLCSALRSQGFSVLPYAVHEMQAWFSTDMICNQILSYAVSVRNSFSHVVFVGSSFVPIWLIESIRRSGVKVIYWALEDPHALDQDLEYYPHVDYYFSNEKRVRTLPDCKNAYYVPTAADHNACMPIREDLKDVPDHLKYDIVFQGNVYPSRQVILEGIIPFVKEKGYKLGILGITKLMNDPKTSPLREFIIPGFEGVVEHRWLIYLYGCSKIGINLERDSFYEYSDKATNRKHRLIGESLNPRAYEIPLCAGALQLIDNKRAEIFSGKTIQDKKHCVVFENIVDLCKKIEYYIEHEDERRAIVKEAQKYTLENHTYLSRAIRIVNIIRMKEGKQDQVVQSVLNNLLKKKK